MSESEPALLTRSEIQWLLGNSKPSNGQERFMRHCINRKLQTFHKLEMPLLAKAGYVNPTDVSAHTNAVSAGTNALRGLQAAVGRGSANPSENIYDIQTYRERNGAGSGNFVPLSGISNPRVLSDMGLAIPRPTRLGDPRPQEH
jgi:hypothetical protein